MDELNFYAIKTALHITFRGLNTLMPCCHKNIPQLHCFEIVSTVFEASDMTGLFPVVHWWSVPLTFTHPRGAKIFM